MTIIFVLLAGCYEPALTGLLSACWLVTDANRLAVSALVVLVCTLVNLLLMAQWGARALCKSTVTMILTPGFVAKCLTRQPKTSGIQRLIVVKPSYEKSSSMAPLGRSKLLPS